MIDYETPRRKEFISAVSQERTDYQQQSDPDYWLKLGRAVEYLQQRRIYRGEVDCSHEYTNALGQVTDRREIRVR